MTYIQPNANGQASMANSSPVVLSSDQTAIPVSQATASSFNAQVVGNVASAASDSGNPVKIGGKYNSSLPTFTDGQRGDLQLDANGLLRNTLATLIAGEDLTINVIKVEQRFSGARCTADTLVKSGAGFIHAIIVSQPASTTPTAGVLTVYDNTAESGTVIFQHYFPASAVPTPVTVTLNQSFATGCYVGFDATLASLAFNIQYR